MRKHVFLFLLLFSFCACTKENTDNPADGTTGGGLQLSLVGSDVNQLATAIDTLSIFTWQEGMGTQTFHFGKNEPVVLKDLDRGQHTIFALANMVNPLEYPYEFKVDVSGNSMVVYRSYSSYLLPELLGGMCVTPSNSDATTGQLELKMERLVGGLQVNIVNRDSLQSVNSIEMNIYNTYQTVCIGEERDRYVLETRFFVDGLMKYVFPTDGPVRGQLVIHGNDADGMDVLKYLDFTAKNPIEANKKLELNFKVNLLPKTRSAAGGTIECIEKVTDL